MEQKDTDYAYLSKFKYNISNPTQEFGLYYGAYVPLAARSNSFSQDLYNPKAGSIIFDIDEYDFIRFRPETTEIWYSNSEDINQYAYLYFENGSFGFDTFIY